MAETSESLEQRIAKKYGLGQEEPLEQPQEVEAEQPEIEDDTDITDSDLDDTETPETTEDLEEVEYDGEPLPPMPASLAKKVREALMRNKDYTEGKQKLASSQRNLELQQQQVREFLEQQAFEKTLSDDLHQQALLEMQIGQYRNLDWSSMSDSDILRRRVELDQLKETKAQLDSQLGAKRAQFSQDQKKRLEEALNKAHETLAKNINGWGESLAKDVSDWALSRGYTTVEVNNIWNPRDVETLYKAMNWDRLVAAKQGALTKAQQAPPVVKPGSVKPMPAEKRDQLNFRKAMKKANAEGATASQKARLIQKRLEEKFR